MAYTPGWFTTWAEAQSLNPARPDLWPDAARAAFMAEKLVAFKRRWRWLSAIGQPAVIRAQSGRAELIRQVRRDLDDALTECPRMGPYESFRPPHPGRSHAERPAEPPWRGLPIEDVFAWVEAKPERLTMSETVARCLCWLEREFDPGRTSARLTRGSLEPNAATGFAPGAPVNPRPLTGAATSR